MIALIRYTGAMKTKKPKPTVRDALHWCTEVLEASDAYFGHGTDNAWDDAVQLVFHALDLPLDAPEEVLGKPLSAMGEDRLAVLLDKRAAGKVPVPYLTGKAWFADLEFLCDDRALIPRSPMAELILDGFRPWYAGAGPRRILDVCCGGGCIGLAAAHYFPEASVDLLDIDPRALALARDNAAYLDLQTRVSIMQSDLFSALGQERYDVILSSPPYVDSADLAAMPAEYSHEPALGLASGQDGLDAARRILAGAAAYLKQDGVLFVEVGNSSVALEQAFPDVPFTWLEFERGGHGVFTLTAPELQEYSAYFVR